MKRTASHTLQVIIEQDEAGCFVAECPALKAWYTQGKRYEAVVANSEDVGALCLADLRARGQPIPSQPEIVGIKRVQVSCADFSDLRPEARR